VNEACVLSLLLLNIGHFYMHIHLPLI